MLTALISALTGLFSAVVPDVVKEITTTRQHGRDIETKKLDNELELKKAEAGLQAANVQSEAQIIASIEATVQKQVENIQNQKTGIYWIDFINAALRPLTMTIVLAMFTFTGIGLLNIVPS